MVQNVFARLLSIKAFNSEVRAVLNGEPSQGSRKGKKHHIYSSKERAEIGRLAGQIELGLLKQQENFLGSWVIHLMKVLLVDLRNCMTRKKRKRMREEPEHVTEIPLKKKGDPCFLV